MRKLSVLLAFVIMVPSLVCAQAPVRDPVVAKVGGDEVRRSEVQDLLEAYGEKLGDMPPAERFEVGLERAIDMRLMARAARSAGLHQNPEVRRQIAQAERDVLQEALIAQIVERETSERGLRERYKQEYFDGKGARQVKVRHILTYTKGQAEQFIRRLEDGADFQTLARESSVDSRTAPQGGELGWIGKDDASRPFVRAALAVKVGRYSRRPVETEHGWHVIKVEDERFDKAPPFEAVRDELAKTAVQDTIASLLERMREDVKVERVDAAPAAETRGRPKPEAAAGPKTAPEAPGKSN